MKAPVRPVIRDLFGNTYQWPAFPPRGWRVSCYVLVEHSGKLLMVEPAWSPKWELPGGEIDIRSGETLIEGAIRECREETGYVIRPHPETLQLVTENFYTTPRRDRYDHALVFLVRAELSQDAPATSIHRGEVRRVLWINPANISEDTTQWMHADILRTIGTYRH